MIRYSLLGIACKGQITHLKNKPVGIYLLCAIAGLAFVTEAIAKCGVNETSWELTLISIEAEDGSTTEIDPEVAVWASDTGVLTTYNSYGGISIKFQDPDWLIHTGGP